MVNFTASNIFQKKILIFFWVENKDRRKESKQKMIGDFLLKPDLVKIFWIPIAFCFEAWDVKVGFINLQCDQIYFLFLAGHSETPVKYRLGFPKLKMAGTFELLFYQRFLERSELIIGFSGKMTVI